MKKWIKILLLGLLTIFNTGYAFVYAYIFPFFIAIAFYMLNGAVCDYDAAFFAPVGWFLIAFFPFLYLIINGIIFFKLWRKEKSILGFWLKVLLIVVLTFIIGASIAIILINMFSETTYFNGIFETIKERVDYQINYHDCSKSPCY
ncbi:MAG: hypothetical protein FWH14_07410 [Oscillospiraceae bacterium]|nr:hypothetical protein [Oscillospiraceae bacterium]